MIGSDGTQFAPKLAAGLAKDAHSGDTLTVFVGDALRSLRLSRMGRVEIKGDDDATVRANRYMPVQVRGAGGYEPRVRVLGCLLDLCLSRRCRRSLT